MRLVAARIQNFKGIQQLDIDFGKAPASNIYTLIGLNESGKTTILEALNAFRYRDESFSLNHEKSDPRNYIPVKFKGNFSGSISITLTFSISLSDKKQIADHLAEHLNCTVVEVPETIVINDVYRFEHSEKIDTNTRITFEVLVRYKGRRKAEALTGDNWKVAIREARALVPAILYFPDFSHDIPDTINLEQPSDPKEQFFCQLFCDILASYDPDLDLYPSIIQRMKSGDATDRRTVDALFEALSKHLTKRIYEPWNQIFSRPIGNKEIVMRPVVSPGTGRVSVQLTLKDGAISYALGERSRGFVWFFCYILLTEFRPFRKDDPKQVIFLFDEPASNLHASAQERLLQSFDRLSRRSMLIYSTHSHHLINPLWLEGAYIVRNVAYDYDGVDADVQATDTDIKIRRYRDFVGQHPRELSYFQPVLEALDYKPASIELQTGSILVEGKNDYFLLKHFNRNVLGGRYDVNILPCNGASGMECLISLFLGWGMSFVILFDDDEEGGLQKARYVDVFGEFIRSHIFTLGEINPAFDKKRMEDLLSTADKKAIAKAFYPQHSTLKKQHLYRAVQEMCMTGKFVDFESQTITSIDSVLEFLVSLLE